MDLHSGKIVCFLYPASNYKHISHKRMEPRRIFVLAVRDLHERPLDTQTVETEPLLERGRFLVTGWCFDRQAERSFYINSMEELEPFEPPAEFKIPIAKDGRIDRVVTIADVRPLFAKAYNAIDDRDMALV